MISHRHRCIYVKVPKCGSTAVLEWFAEHGGGRHSFRPWWYGGLLAERIRGVAGAMNLYPDYFTFTFVRDPYERFVSIWLYLSRLAEEQRRRGRGHPAGYGSLRECAELCRDVFADFGARWGREAQAFFRANGEREYGPGRVPLKHLGWLVDHARPQADFLPDCHPRRLFGVRRTSGDPLSFVGAVETLEADFARLAARLGLPDAPLRQRNASGFGAGARRAARYAEFYDDATRRLVEELYADDLAVTGAFFATGRIAVPGVRPNAPAGAGSPAPRPGLRTLAARAWRRLGALEIELERRVVRSATARRLLRPLGRLRGART